LAFFASLWECELGWYLSAEAANMNPNLGAKFLAVAQLALWTSH
jgi:hypothetical protein